MLHGEGGKADYGAKVGMICGGEKALGIFPFHAEKCLPALKALKNRQFSVFVSEEKVGIAGDGDLFHPAQRFLDIFRIFQNASDDSPELQSLDRELFFIEGGKCTAAYGESVLIDALSPAKLHDICPKMSMAPFCHCPAEDPIIHFRKIIIIPGQIDMAVFRELWRQDELAASGGDTACRIIENLGAANLIGIRKALQLFI